jgi:hypothetical protein
MKRTHIIAPVILALFLVASAFSQDWDSPGRGGGQNRQRLERFRKMRMVEVLGLNEEQSVRFFAKQNAHDTTVAALIKTRNEALDKIQKLEKSKADAGEYEKPISDVLAADESIFKERQRYEDEMKTFLSPDKFGKFLVFERNFGRNVREAMQDMYREHNRGKDGDNWR